MLVEFNGELEFDDAVALGNANLYIAAAAEEPKTAWFARSFRSEGLTITVRFDGSMRVPAWWPAMVLVIRVAGHAIRGSVSCNSVLDGKSDWERIDAYGKGNEAPLHAVPEETVVDRVL